MLRDQIKFQITFKCMWSSLRNSQYMYVPQSDSSPPCNCAVVSEWLLERAWDFIDPTNIATQHRYTALWGFNELWQIPAEIKPRFLLTETELLRLGVARKAAFMAYYTLHKMAAEENRNKYNITPKLHVMDHMVRRTLRTGVSYHLYWTFSSEDFIGSIAKVCGKTHGSSTHARALQRWAVFFWVKYMFKE